MEQVDIDRTIGRMEEAVSTLKSTVPEILGAIETSRAQRAKWEHDHSNEDRGQFSKLHESFGNMNLGLTRLENLREAVEGHGRALVNMENRLTEVESAAAVAKATAETARTVNARWSRGLLTGAAAVGAAAGTAGTTVGPKLWKTIVDFLKAL